MPRKDPYRQFRFRVEIDGISEAGFSECSFEDTTTDPVEYREGDDLPTVRKLSGLTKFGNITLKWGITDSMDIYNWRQQIIDTGVAYSHTFVKPSDGITEEQAKETLAAIGSARSILRLVCKAVTKSYLR